MARSQRTAAGEGRLAGMTSIAASLVLAFSAWRARSAPIPHPPEQPFQPEAPDNVLGRLDAAQRRLPVVSFIGAVFKKFGDDGGGRLAAQLTYSSFLSMFPLLLVLTTVLGYVLDGRRELQQSLLDSALVQFPIIGDQLGSNITSLKGSAVALAIGIAAALWGGMGVVQAAQDILANVWMVPRRRRPGFVPRLLKATLVLVMLFGGLVTTSAIVGLGANLPELGWPGRAAILVVTVVVNSFWFGLAFKILLAEPVAWKQVWPGAVTVAAGWQLLLLLGTFLVDRQLRGATQSYGFFGIVLGLLGWLALLATVLVVGAEVNAVRAHGLWPRSLTTPALTEDDRRALEATARVEERAPGQRVDVAFRDPEHSDG